MFIEQVIEDAKTMDPKPGFITTFRYILDLPYTSEQINDMVAELSIERPDLTFFSHFGEEYTVPYFYIQGIQKQRANV